MGPEGEPGSWGCVGGALSTLVTLIIVIALMGVLLRVIAWAL